MGLGAAVTGRIQGTRPLNRSSVHELPELGTRQQARIDTEVFRDTEPAGKLVELLVRSRREETATASETDVFTNVLCEVVPDSETLEHHGDFARVTTLYPDPAPVAPRLLAGNVAFLAERDRNALPCQEPGS